MFSLIVNILKALPAFVMASIELIKILNTIWSEHAKADVPPPAKVKAAVKDTVATVAAQVIPSATVTLQTKGDPLPPPPTPAPPPQSPGMQTLQTGSIYERVHHPPGEVPDYLRKYIDGKETL